MSYPPPPPPGQGGPPYGPGPYQGDPYGANPYGQPPKKDNTLWWILGGIAAVVFICCIGVCGVLVFVANEAEESISSVSSSINAPQNEKAASATAVAEGDSVTVDGVAVQGGWTLAPNEISGLSMRNDSGTSGVLSATFYLMEGGSVSDSITCTTTFLDAGESDTSPSCYGGYKDSLAHDEIRVAEGF